MESYIELKQRHDKEFSEFKHIFFAFNKEQFQEGLIKIGLKENELNKLVSIGLGGYVLKSEIKTFENMLYRQNKERKELKNSHKKLLEALIYELINHEYIITYDVAPALEALNLNIADIPDNILKKACKEAVKRVN